MARRVTRGLYLVSRLEDELDQAFARAGDLAETESQAADLAPPMDVIENDRQVVIVLEVPGLEVADLEIETRGNRLTIRGRRPPPTAGPGPVRYFCMECRHGDFQRSIELIGALDTRGARARLARGLLRIEIPKIGDRRHEARKIAIEWEEED